MDALIVKRSPPGLPVLLRSQMVSREQIIRDILGEYRACVLRIVLSKGYKSWTSDELPPSPEQFSPFQLLLPHISLPSLFPPSTSSLFIMQFKTFFALASLVAAAAAIVRIPNTPSAALHR